MTRVEEIFLDTFELDADTFDRIDIEYMQDVHWEVWEEISWRYSPAP